MRFSFSAEQEEFRATVRRALEARSPTKEVRRLMATDAGFERDGWQKLNQELGLTALHIPEAYGGGGFGYSELGIVLEEMGRGLLCAPYFSTAALATTAILNAGTEEQKKALLPRPRRRHGDRDPRLRRGRRQQRSGEHRTDGLAVRRRPGGWTAPRASCSTGTPPISSSWWRAGRARTVRTALLLHGRRQRLGPEPTQLKTMDETRKLAQLTVQVGRGAAARHRGRRGRDVRQDDAAGADLPRQRDGRRRRAAARGRARIRARCACSSAGRSPRSRP